MYADGFKYWLAYSKNNIKYYRCCLHKKQCPGRCVVEDGRAVRITTEHNHDPEPDRIVVEKFRKVLTRRAATETTDLHNIYWEEASHRHGEAALLYSYNLAESAMRKARRKQLPTVPTTMYELTEALKVSELFRVSCGNRKEAFYRTTVDLEEGSCVIFMHAKTLQAVGKVEEMHVDASVDCIARPRGHLLTIHAVQGHKGVPILYAILTTKSQSTFAAVFAFLRENYPSQVVPSIILTNFDAAMHFALLYTFPEANLKGSWFHYTDAVVGRLKHLRLQREITKGHGACALKMLLVLPFLPADHMAAGLVALKKWMQEKKVFTVGLSTICTYVEHEWLRGVGPEKMSMFGVNRCTNTYVQTFNKELLDTIDGRNNIIWHFLDSLTHIATKTYTKLARRAKDTGLPGPKPPRKTQMATEEIIRVATEQWIRTPLHLRSPFQFLQMASHCINDSNYAVIVSTIAAPPDTPDTPAAPPATKRKAPEPIIDIHSNVTFVEVPQITQPLRFISSDPPPLAFFPKVTATKKNLRTRPRFPLEPPPLVPISRRKVS
ncbi:uncharacterized protein LOC129803513 [Phlebotomus papatasi]|uniref:uncharacterized protein LOC129803513 n=1 Tax=Phlebotomus papatasi TaxID=29031 RepID=UPI0024833AB8|nr:uncharacterized protein LOC129803513 [Phlebotomus papatasi]